jgi:hypothetical protein
MIGSKASSNPVPVAKSMRAEEFELVSSDDSDWTLFYKNDLNCSGVSLFRVILTGLSSTRMT